MKTRLLNLWESTRTSFWLIPSLMVMGALGLAMAAVAIDRSFEFRDRGLGMVLYMGGPEGAGTLLSTIAGSAITVAGVAFSIIIVALTLTSSQFGSRLLRNFVRDKGNQFVLGAFIGTFTYGLLVLRSIYGPADEAFVPSVSVTIAMALALLNVGVLIYFIHHVSTSIQAEQVVTGVYRELLERIDAFFPDQLGEACDTQDPDSQSGDEAAGERLEIHARQNGYLQAIDVEGLFAVACETGLHIDVAHRPGEFIVPGGVLAWVRHQEKLDAAIETRIANAFIVGLNRTPEQDPEFAIHQLAEIAIRALSPGINDPFTAMTCVDQLGAILCMLTRRALPSPCRVDEEGHVRVNLKPLSFDGMTGAAFDQIRQYGRSSVAVTIRLLEALENVARQARTESQRKAVRRQADMIMSGSRESLPEQQDRDDVKARFEAVIAALESDTPSGDNPIA